MANYTKIVDFDVKDSLPTGDPGKIIKGTEFEAEFDAISAAIATKADQAGPTFTGTTTFGAVNVTGSFTSLGIDDNATSTAITIDSSQNIGIGATSPKTTLDIIDGSAARIYLGTDASNYGGLVYSGGVMNMRGFGSGTAAVVSADATNSKVTFTTAGVADRMTIDSSGNVGIGDSSRFGFLTNPGGNLQLTGGLISDPGAGIPLEISNYRSAPITFSTSGNIEQMRIDSSGNVGVGIITADSRLHVSPSSFGGNQGDVAITLGNEVTTARGARINKNTSSPYDLTVTAGLNPTNGSDLVFESHPGVETMRLTKDGNVGIANGDVGIGTANPVSYQTGPVLNIGSTSDTYAQLNFTTATNGVQYIGFGDAVTGSARYQGLIQFDHNNNTMGFGTGAKVGADVTIDASGNVGIGETAPLGSLHIKTADSGAANPSGSGDDLVLEGSGNTGITIQTPNTSKGSVFFQDPQSTSAGYLQYDHAVNALTLGSSGVARMHIDASGNVGIGTSVPAYRLAVDVAAAVADTNVGGFNDATDSSAAVWLGHGSTRKSGIKAEKKTTGNDHDLVFYTNPASSDAVDRMRIDASGNLLVGKTEAGVDVAGCLVQSTGDIRISKPGAASDTMLAFYKNASATAVGTITSTSTATAYNTSSDERLKDNVVDAPAGNLDAVQVRSFDWKSNGEHQTYGFIAQELEVVAPYAVTKGEAEDDMWSVDYSKLVPMLVKEIQDLKAKVEALENA